MSFKIAQIVCQIPPDAGGIGMVAHSYADQLTRRGHDVTVFVPRTRGNAVESKSYKVAALWPLVKFGYGALLPQLAWRLRGFDIIHLHYPFFATAFLTVLHRNLWYPKTKLVINYHMDVNLSGWRGIYEKCARRLALNYILKSADKIIVSSEDYIENSRIQEFYFKNINKFYELPFGVSRRFVPEPKDGDLLAKYGLAKDDKVVLFAGGLDSAHYFKGVNYLIKAISLIEDKKIKALIIGAGDLLADYKKLVSETKLGDRVKFADYVPADSLVKHYNLGDVFILPSINNSEAFGIVLIEAMACGKPVIATNLKGVRSVVDIGVNGLLVEPKNSKDIADKINLLLGNLETYSRFSRNCLETVAAKYRWATITDNLEKLYKQLLQK
ncbi:hypothetical protein A2482_00630 [Candidatus Falkowbacteria bacterium RIFOXYC2_FULL_48_21]|uniref:Glycosyltransferase subfamily 4-like N-terminal domain-containing protein n=1 Tax=Candidatus Falkowbacteria bacterium RIFOXYC2_FULL_48_21 TaxID=1798005 RepID=A0A1F5T5N1_9BACT|nr:MAG: hypothetical protein A2482_00630 [Candidatus Falkowbacteria bacterium RIFOXYC2_FULL_48_21]